MQSFSYTIKAQVNIEFKMPIFSIFQTPYGFSSLQATGPLVMHQKATFAQGAANR
jgi:hypothetical protein